MSIQADNHNTTKASLCLHRLYMILPTLSLILRIPSWLYMYSFAIFYLKPELCSLRIELFCITISRNSSFLPLHTTFPASICVFQYTLSQCNVLKGLTCSIIYMELTAQKEKAQGKRDQRLCPNLGPTLYRGDSATQATESGRDCSSPIALMYQSQPATLKTCSSRLVLCAA